MPNKICIKCNLNDDESFFIKDKNICKKCIKNKKHEYYLKNRNKIIEKNKKYNEENKDVIKVRKKKYYNSNKKNILKESKKYRIENKDKIKERRKIYYNKNKKIINNINDKYKKDNKLTISIKNRNYRITNIEKVLFNKAKDRAKRKSILFDITLDDIKNIMPKDNICPFLGIKMCVSLGSGPSNNSFSLDRINSNKGYTKENIQIISNKANTSKNNITLNQYKIIVNNLERIIKFGISYNYEYDGDLKSNFNNARKRVRKYNIPFDITYEDVKKVYPIGNICPLLGVELIKGKKIFCDQSPTLDRIFPSLGYVVGNIMIISFKANLVKNNLSLEEMKKILKKWMVINGK